MKPYQVVVQWGTGMKYFVGAGFSNQSQAEAEAVRERQRTMRVFKNNDQRGAKPTVYVLKVVSDA